MQTHVQGVIQKQPDCVRIFFTLYDYETKLSANKPLFKLDLRPKNYISEKNTMDILCVAKQPINVIAGPIHILLC